MNRCRPGKGSPPLLSALAPWALAAALASVAAAPLRAGAAGGGAAPPRFLLVPGENAVLPPGKVLVVGIAGTDNGLARVEVNGRISGFATVRGRAFHLQVTLPEGESTLRAAAGGWTAEAVVRAAKDGAWRPHPALEQCASCHGAATGGPSPWAVPPPVARACERCHPGKGSGKHVHGPAALGQCTACHDPHGSSLPALGRDGRGCFACHEPFPPGESVHRPAAEGKCHACHDPHSSPLPTHLEREGELVCTECHRSDGYHEIHRAVPEPGASRLSVPDDFPRRGSALLCTGCHAPHRSANRRLLREGKELCTRCHPF